MQTDLTATRKYDLRKVFIEIICYAYILLFLYASVYKLLDIPLFERQLEQSPLLGNYRYFIAWAVPLCELAIAVMLFFTRLRFIAMILATTMMVAFTAYIVYLLNFAPTVPCSCGGIMATMGWRNHLVFNSVFIALGCTNLFLLRPFVRK